ncbi:hypothetical protein ACQY0O_003613 [Thecaphora frezii]
MSNPFNKPSLVSSRFVSATADETAPQPDETYDPRSLYERLKAQKDAKTEKYDEMFKLSNQFRGLDEGETTFLADVQRQRQDEERLKHQKEQEELEAFRKAREAKLTPLPIVAPTATNERRSGVVNNPDKSQPPPPAAGVVAGKKRKKQGLLGVVRKKPAAASSGSSGSVKTLATPKQSDEATPNAVQSEDKAGSLPSPLPQRLGDTVEKGPRPRSTNNDDDEALRSTPDNVQGGDDKKLGGDPQPVHVAAAAAPAPAAEKGQDARC